MAEVIVRIGLAVAALAIAGALAVQERAHDLVRNAAEVAAQPHPKPADADARLKDLKTVDDLRPGSQGALTAAALELRLARYPAAIRAATRATEREPDNFSAWVTLGVARGNAGDGAGRRAAFVRAHILDPLYPVPR
jgi:Flp pilus assembly protein TadD